MRELKYLALALAAIVSLTSTAAAQSANSCCSVCGKKVCKLEVSASTEKYTGFEVTSKDVCIPGIKLPWQCERKCAGVRTVCVLEEVQAERPVCKYDWSVKVICTTCCKHHNLKRGLRSCDVCRDERVPFDYYAVEPLPELGVGLVQVQTVAATSRLPVIEEPLQSPVGIPLQATQPATRKTPSSLSPLAKLRESTSAILSSFGK